MATRLSYHTIPAGIRGYSQVRGSVHESLNATPTIL